LGELRSPRTRGWSHLPLAFRVTNGAFPAYAGVVPRTAPRLV